MGIRREEIAVHLDAPELGGERRVGVLRREHGAGKTVASFSHDRDWLDDSAFFQLAPDIGSWEGEQHFSAMPGIFSDSAPDRWGRTLMDRREAMAARREDRRSRQLDDFDYLLGVSDGARMGALRFVGEDGTYLDDSSFAVPPSTYLRELQAVAREAERGLPKTASDEEKWIRMLIAPGSSLGGTRPKANYLDQDGSMWIAKFPSRDDRLDVGAWEYVMWRLARSAGIDMADAAMHRLDSTQATFATRRFDRRGPDQRRLYASAMTLSSRRDGDEGGYLDIAMAIRDLGDPGHIGADQQQLFRRLVFNVLTANRDDHLRNHGFLRTSMGWRISPAFDVNPDPTKYEHALAVTDGIHEGDLDLVTETADLYAVKKPDEVIGEVRQALTGWRKVAKDAGIARDEIDYMGDALTIDS
jgi:serine/threonine-protein kinase HipA